MMVYRPIRSEHWRSEDLHGEPSRRLYSEHVDIRLYLFLNYNKRFNKFILETDILASVIM